MINNATMTSKLRSLWDALRHSPPEVKNARPIGDEWQTFLLGAELRNTPGIAHERQRLLDDLYASEPAAALLVGLLMVFRASPSEKLPMLLKDIGEAYYRWQPPSANGPNRLEVFLTEWLCETCRKAGVAIRISLVHPGERFDSARHYAFTPGVKVEGVLGWTVLRENGKVYTKARVTAK